MTDETDRADRASDDAAWLAERFEEQRPQLRAVAYRMLGSLAEADDAVQDTWLRVDRAGMSGIDNVGGWLTTILSRVCLNMLRSRGRRREDPLEFHVPDPLVRTDASAASASAIASEGTQPEAEALLADSVGLALLVVLDTLGPAERLAFVLHDLFDLPYDEIAVMLDRTPDATKQLASRARRRVRTADLPASAPSRAPQRRAVDAFFAAARDGDIASLVEVLDPDAVLRIDAGDGSPGSLARRGADEVAAQTVQGLRSALGRPEVVLHPVLVNGGPGVVATVHGRPISIVGFAFRDGRIAEIDAIAGPERVRALAAQAFGTV